MRRAAALLLLAGCSGCPTTPQPLTAQDIYSKLVDAGCMQQTSDGLSSIQQEMNSQGQPPWMTCLVAGGSVQACGGCPK